MIKGEAMRAMIKKGISVLLVLMILSGGLSFAEGKGSWDQQRIPTIAKTVKKSQGKITSEKEFEEILVQKIVANVSPIKLDLDNTKISQTTIRRVLDKLGDIPEVLSVSRKFSAKWMVGRGITKLTVEPTYNKGSKDVVSFAKEWVKNNISPEMTQEQKVRTIHDHMVLEYGYSKSLDPEQNNGYDVYSPASLIYQKNGVCQAYSLLFYELAKNSGLEVRVVSGTMLKGGGHAWNYVKVDGNWYAIDITHDDPIPDKEGRVIYDYYLRSDEYMANSRKWDRSKAPQALFDHSASAQNAPSSDAELEDTLVDENTGD